ncbi:MAG: hypothetical protein HRK26_01535 [Rickettsiaceae bacterium H1]|nr:hypothetical protein [Rickettsiaceae bacterium H1]
MLNKLKINDKVKFSSLTQPQLSNKEFSISQVNKYKFKNAANISCKIEKDNHSFYVSSIENDQIAVSRILTDEEIQKNFNLLEFSSIFSSNVNFNINVQCKNSLLDSWFEPVYTKNFDYVVGIYYDNGNLYSGDKFFYYTIGAEKSSIDIEVFDSGRVIFYVTVYLSNSSIVI